MGLNLYQGGDQSLPLGLLATLAVGLSLVVLPFVTIPSSIQFVFGLLAVLFFPGYAFVMALFPRRAPENTETVESEGLVPKSVGTVERLVLSLGLSVCMVPLIALALDYTTIGITTEGVLVSVGLATMGLAVLALERWVSTPESERFAVPVRRKLSATWAWMLGGDDRGEMLLNVVLVVGLVVSMGGIAVAVATPHGEEYTAFYLLGEDPETGALVADQYPQTLSPEGTDLHVGITNQEREAVDYTVVVLIQEVDGDRVQNEEVLDRFTVSLSHGETAEQDRTVQPSLDGDRLRLTLLLYEGEAPAAPGTESAYRHLHVWVDVA